MEYRPTGQRWCTQLLVFVEGLPADTAVSLETIRVRGFTPHTGTYFALMCTINIYIYIYQVYNAQHDGVANTYSTCFLHTHHIWPRAAVRSTTATTINKPLPHSAAARAN